MSNKNFTNDQKNDHLNIMKNNLKRYYNFAQDAKNSGDLVEFEMYSQYVEHYQRMLNNFAIKNNRINSGSSGYPDKKNQNHDVQNNSDKPLSANVSDDAGKVNKPDFNNNDIKEPKKQLVDKVVVQKRKKKENTNISVNESE